MQKLIKMHKYCIAISYRGLVAQMVEHHTGVVEVWVRFPPKSWNVSQEKFQDPYTSVIGLIFMMEFRPDS